MTDDVAAYIKAIDEEQRPLFDRVHRLFMEMQPDAQVVLSYRMPTYVVGTRRLHVGVWKHGLSFYGWEHGRDSALVTNHPHLDNGKGTFRLPVNEAARISDDELRAFADAVLSE
jgi:uncharacterized protein YdhG (YjbR/CyaY superfamily)